MQIPAFRASRGHVPASPWRRALLLAALLALPFGCDDDGTSPPDPDVDELPDTMAAGVYEVGDVHLGAGDTVLVDGDVVILSTGVVRIDGGIRVAPSGSLVIAADDSLIVAGRVAVDSLPSDSAEGVSPMASSRFGNPGTVGLAGNVVRILGETDIAGGAIAGIGAASVIEIDGYVRARDGRDSRTPGVPGEKGADLHIGTPAAIEILESAGVSAASRPATVHVLGQLHAGRGGRGDDDQSGTSNGTTLVAVGSDGGDGGSLFIEADELWLEPDAVVEAGDGAIGGSCGWTGSLTEATLIAADGAAGEPGHGIHCTTGSGGDGGSVVTLGVGSVVGDAGIEGGRGAPAGAFLGRAGSGGLGAPGGSIDVFYGEPGASGTPVPATPASASIAVVHTGGNGGGGFTAGQAGGNGGSITLQRAAGGEMYPLAVIMIRGRVAAGGTGADNCDAPFGPGGAGGAGGVLTYPATSPIEYHDAERAFDGGDGGDGAGPGAGGAGGMDSHGSFIGDSGTAGTACNQPASVTEVEPLEDILGESTPVELVIRGVEFGAGCEITVNGAEVEGECASETEASATVPPAGQQHGDNEVCVSAPPPGGGIGDCGTFVLRNPAAVIHSLGLDGAPVGSPDATVRVYGAFRPGVRFSIGGVQLDSVGAGPGYIDVRIPGSELTSTGDRIISAENPAPHAGVATATFSVYGAVTLGEPDVATLERDTAGERVVYVPIDGHYRSTDRAFVNGVETIWETFVDGVIAVTITEEHMDRTGTLEITFDNGSPSNAVTVDVVNPEPDIYGIDPLGIPMGSPDTEVTVFGHFFDDFAFTFDGVPVEVVAFGDEQATLLIPGALLTTPRRVDVVGHYEDGQSASTFVDVFTGVTLGTADAPALMRGDPGAVVVIPLSGFYASTDSVFANGQRVDFVISGLDQITVTIPAALLANAGPVEIVYDNGLPSTNSVVVVVKNPAPSLISILPDDAPVGSGDLSVTVRGANIAPGAVVWFGGVPMPTTVVDDSTATLVVPASVFEEPGNLPVWIENPHADDTSDIGAFIVFGAVTILPLETPSLARGGGDTTIVVMVTGVYSDEAQVLVNGEPVATEHIGEGLLRATIPGQLLQTPGALDVTVDDQGVHSTNSVQVSVENPVPAISAFSQEYALVGTTEVLLTITGTGFVEETTVSWASTPLEITARGATSLTVRIPGALLGTETLELISVTSPGPGGGTAARSFEVLDPAPVLDALVPASAPEGSPSSVVTLQGSGFVYTIADCEGFTVEPTCSRVYWVEEDDDIIELEIEEFVSPEVLRVIVPAELLTDADFDGLVFVEQVHLDPTDGVMKSFESASLLFDVTEAADLCDVASPDLPTLAYGVMQSYVVDSSHCPGPVIGGNQTYYRLYRIATGQTANQLALQPGLPTEFSILTPNGALMGFFVSSFRKAFYAPGSYVVKVATSSSWPSGTDGDITIGPAAVEELLGCTGADIFDASTTQTLSTTLEDLSCVNGNAEGDERRLDRFTTRVPPGRTVRVTMTSSDVDPVLLFRIPPSDTYVVDETLGDGVAVVTFTNEGTSSVAGEITATTDYLNPGSEGLTGSYTLTVELLSEP